MVKGHFKRPLPRAGPHLKAPTGPPPHRTDSERPTFALHGMVYGYCLDTCPAARRGDLAQAMWLRSKMTWQQIKATPHRGLGAEPLSALDVPLPPHVTPDVTILSFRTPGEARMIGYRSGETFHIIWFDWKFEVYDHGS